MRTLSFLYSQAVKGRSFFYKNGYLQVHQVPGIKVISIGNLNTGGSGKSPFARYIAQWLSKQQHTALLLRGYKGQLENRGGLVSHGNGPLISAAACGDEAYEAAITLRNITIRVGANRIQQARLAAQDGAELVVLDDGFQHRKIHRNLDILLTCPDDQDPRTRLLPQGPLREPYSASARADLLAGFEAEWVNQPNPPPILYRYNPIHVPSFEPVFLLAGIARPKRFMQTAMETGFSVVGHAFWPDHHPYTEKQIASLYQQAKNLGAKAILTTGKDHVRLEQLFIVKETNTLPIVPLKIQLEITQGKSLLEQKLQSIVNSK